MYRFGFQVAASRARYGSIASVAFYSRSASGFISFFIFQHLVFIMFILDCAQMDAVFFFFLLKLLFLLLLKAFKMFMPDAVL